MSNRNKVACRGGSIQHKVTLRNYLPYDIDAGFVSYCNNSLVAYPDGDKWEPIPVPLKGCGLRLKEENSWDFEESLRASDGARRGQRTRLTIASWRRRKEPAALLEPPPEPTGVVVETVKLV